MEVPATPDPGMLTVTEVARLIRTSPNFIRDEIARGKLKGTRFGQGKGVFRIKLADWNAYLKTVGLEAA